MATVSLKAHFDGQSIQLDEPFELPTNAQLLVVVLPAAHDGGDGSDWMELSANGLARAYGPDEPTYSEADLLP